MDYWSGTFMLVVVALVEVIIFAWIYGMEKGWNEILRGADIKPPKIFFYIIKYITPAYILFILVFWTVEEAIPTFFLVGVAGEKIPYIWGARVFMVLLLIALFIMVHLAWKKNKHKFKYD